MSEHPAPADAPSSCGVLLTVAYDGASFSGWARQENAPTVAAELTSAVRAVDPDATDLRGASRTDAGVHALGQRVSFGTTRQIAPRGWVLALTQHLPREIGVIRASHVAADFDPRRHAVKKTYRYLILESAVHDPFWHQRAWRIHQRLNQSLLLDEASSLIGTHDFRAFRSAHDTREHTVRTILRADVSRDVADPRILRIEVQGDRFMHRMMRIICGTLMEVALGRLAPGAVRRGISTGDRRALGVTAPPDGLYLVEVDLDSPPGDTWPRLAEPERP